MSEDRTLLIFADVRKSLSTEERRVVEMWVDNRVLEIQEEERIEEVRLS